MKSNDHYVMEILSESHYKYYTRRYMKFQDLVALLNSFMNLLSVITESLYVFYNRFRMKTYLFKRLVIPKFDNVNKILAKNNLNEIKIDMADS
jgi:hypothetical protein